MKRMKGFIAVTLFIAVLDVAFACWLPELNVLKGGVTGLTRGLSGALMIVMSFLAMGGIYLSLATYNKEKEGGGAMFWPYACFMAGHALYFFAIGIGYGLPTGLLLLIGIAGLIFYERQPKLSTH